MILKIIFSLMEIAGWIGVGFAAGYFFRGFLI